MRNHAKPHLTRVCGRGRRVGAFSVLFRMASARNVSFTWTGRHVSISSDGDGAKMRQRQTDPHAGRAIAVREHGALLDTELLAAVYAAGAHIGSATSQKAKIVASQTPRPSRTKGTRKAATKIPATTGHRREPKAINRPEEIPAGPKTRLLLQTERKTVRSG